MVKIRKCDEHFKYKYVCSKPRSQTISKLHAIPKTRTHSLQTFVLVMHFRIRTYTMYLQQVFRKCLCLEWLLFLTMLLPGPFKWKIQQSKVRRANITFIAVMRRLIHNKFLPVVALCNEICIHGRYCVLHKNHAGPPKSLCLSSSVLCLKLLNRIILLQKIIYCNSE